MTIDAFQSLIFAYVHAIEHRKWVIKNIDHFKFETVEAPKVAWQAAMDQEHAALRDVLQAGKALMESL